MSRRKLAILLVGVCAIAIGGAALLFALITNHKDSREDAAIRPTVAELTALSADVTSGSMSRVKTAFLIREDQQLEPDFLTATKQWESLEFDAKSYAPLSKEMGTIDAALTNAGEVAVWKLTLQFVDGQWRVLMTEGQP